MTEARDIAHQTDPAEALTRHIEALRAQVRMLRGAAIDAGASLAGAISLLERGGKQAAPSDRMFDQMLVDYRAALERTRAALMKVPLVDTVPNHTIIALNHTKAR